MPQSLTSLPRGTRARQDSQLFERYRRTGAQDARAELLERFLPLANHLARRYAHRGESDDLRQVASFALLKAIDRYDPERGRAFSSYAVPTILGELKRYFRDFGWAVRLPRELQERAQRVQRAASELNTTLGRSPTPGELADATELSVEETLEALEAARAHHAERLDPPSDDGDAGDWMVGTEERGYAVAEAAGTLSPLLARLTPREREILRLRFKDDLTQTEIAELVGTSQMQISRILRRAIERLQELAEA